MNGEWWIDDTGSVTFCDGDIGDMCHEGYIIGILSRQFLMWLGIDRDEASLAEEDDAIAEVLREDYADKFTEDEIVGDPIECARKVCAEMWAKREGPSTMDQFDEAWFCACNCGNHDARNYAVKYMGYIRVIGSCLQAKSLDALTLKTMERGIDEIYEQNGDDGPDDDTEFGLEFLDHGYFPNVPWSLIKENNPLAIKNLKELSHA